MTILPQEILDAIVDSVHSKEDLESLSLTHRYFLPRSRWHLFSTIRLLHGRHDSSLNYESTASFTLAVKRYYESLPLSSFLAAFKDAVAKNSLITSSVRTLTLSLYAGDGNPNYDTEMPDPDVYLPFANLRALQVLFAHSYYDIIDIQTTQKWRFPRLLRLIQMNSLSLQHLAIDKCSLQDSSWDSLFCYIASLKQLHTFVLRDALISCQVPILMDEESLSLGGPTGTSISKTEGISGAGGNAQHLKRLFLDQNEPELEREALSTSRYFPLSHLDALALRFRSNHYMWGQIAVLSNVGNVLTSLTIDIEDHFVNESTLQDITLPNLAHFQLISERLDDSVYTIFSWLIHQSTRPFNHSHSDSNTDLPPYNNPSSKLRFIHLTFSLSVDNLVDTLADTQLTRLISSIPLLEVITADVTLTEFRLVAQTGEECLERNFPTAYETGKIKYGKVDQWWELR
ncbi:hypothetical protein GYMLUDRAFT_251623 [Collybiopsis luxurians FD-317 M1]|uniref:F-box domain-containing protein n=1 Tax=Collybiopsis luxurians FD-317 M1 TaxID=944289 RepID=A0A0D0C279_9AGAR|nr:hypothetical protein GYMLUDRAFT_251623 [Collybiopsis luxurians FD-317 M1]